jgi:hypothetical protein
LHAAGHGALPGGRAEGGHAMNYFVHESSFVDEGAIVGAGSKIWHFSHVRFIGSAAWPAVNPTSLRCGGLEFDLRLDNKSRMSREVHVRFREGLGVQFPRATRLVICCRGTADEAMRVMRDMMDRPRTNRRM